MGTEAIWTAAAADVIEDAARWVGDFGSLIVLFSAVAVAGLVIAILRRLL